MVESIGFTLGALWGLIGSIVIDSMFLTIMAITGLFMLMMALILIKHEVFMMPHWSI